MASQFTQLVGESIYYEQDVVNDTIEGAKWTVQPMGPSVTVVQNLPTSSIASFQSGSPGVFLLKVSLTLGSGQIKIGEANIEVVPQRL